MSIPHFALSGPEFLVVYATVAWVTLVICWLYLLYCDDSRAAPAAAMPTAVDSYEVAFLREGETGLVLTVTVALLERGHLRLEPIPEASLLARLDRRKLHIVANDCAPDTLEPLEEVVRHWFERPRDAAELAGQQLSLRVRSFTLRYEESLQAQQLLETAAARHGRQLAFAGGSGLLGALALLRVLHAVPNGKPIGFLVLMCCVVLLSLWWVCRSQRQSSRGEALLSQLRQHSNTLPIAIGSPLVLATALFGTAALAGTQLDSMREYLDTESAGSSSGSGGGGSDGGGDGGGCGGCGGCGG